ncbi:MAG: hypothetical protein MZV63_68955 [Marinilabiliales bacterium]|nr:hypothetical protein [Marinilabiliales bacterium]
MANDQDGAVPWYQGIEFFVAMRRLGKPAWLLQLQRRAALGAEVSEQG